MKKDSSPLKTTKGKKKKLQWKIFQRSLHYTETVFWLLVIHYFLWNDISIILIAIVAIRNGDASALDTFISSLSETFLKTAGVVFIKFAVENVFKYNDFGGLVKHVEGNYDERTDYSEADQ